MNLINKKVKKEENILGNNLDSTKNKFLITDDDFLNVSLLRINFFGFNTYVKENENIDNAIWEFEKIAVIQFLKDRISYFKNFIL